MNNNKTWFDFPCTAQQKFICYNETNQSNKFHLINITKTWPQAENYCREHHTDLISGVHQLEEFKTDKGSYDKDVSMRAKKANTSYVWLGLRYTCTLEFWFWVSDEAVRYKNWASDGVMDDCDMSEPWTGGQHKWFRN
ncbi:snaclec stejaggregin-B subunit beta-1-like protein [Lates japonicus]|uniref:Snaclec stejaggregin-B subunit beta-1-like protein n=1 Tax=Lates japonicus TaxID=270547 RepID=A0AAD3R658_LATJO|nr:snaclec stejaggregin-B subunit beta-1-like protein [Lates japonicus]